MAVLVKQADYSEVHAIGVCGFERANNSLQMIFFSVGIILLASILTIVFSIGISEIKDNQNAIINNQITIQNNQKLIMESLGVEKDE